MISILEKNMYIEKNTGRTYTEILTEVTSANENLMSSHFFLFQMKRG